MARIGFGIVGTGAIHRAHVNALRNLSDSAELVAVADIRPDVAADAAASAGVPPFPSLMAMIDGAQIDAVCICTPPNVHADLAVEALEAGKHVVIEKPADVSLTATDRIIAAAKASSAKATVISQHRFDPSTQVVKRAIEAGRFGKLTRAAAQVRWWRSQEYFDVVPWRGSLDVTGGGALISQSIHTVDLMIWLMGPVAEVFAYSDTLAHERIENEDACAAVVRFRSGALAVVEASVASYPGLSARLEVSGDRGSAIIDGDRLAYFHAALPGEQTGIYGASGDTNRADAELAEFAASDASGAQDPAKLSGAHQEQLRDFISAIREDREPLVTLQDGRDVLEVVFAIYASARTGQPIKVGAR